MAKQIDLYLISGFLGSGKTTFLQKMLNNFEGKKVGVIVNEFGSIGIDGKLIEREGVQLVEINNGSIFCSCIKGDFVKTLIEFTKEDIEVLLIENSGMADPSNMHQIIDEVSDRVRRPYEYKGAVCIIDSVTFLKHVKVLVPVQNQIASSNFIVVNKIDLVNQLTLNEIKDKLFELNPSAYVYNAMYSEVPISLLEQNLYDNGYVGETSNQCNNRPATYSLESEGSYSDTDMMSFINRIKQYVLRMKGFLKGECGWWQVDVVGDYTTILETKIGKRDVIEKTKLVIIGYDSVDFKNEIEEAWNETFREIPRIFE